MQEPLLAGRTVVIFRSEEQADALRTRLESLGAAVRAFPVIRHEALDGGEELAAVLAHRERYGWIAFTSANAARFFATACRERGVDPDAWRHAGVAAVGKATASAAAAAGFAPCDVAAGSGAALAALLVAAIGSRRELRVLLPQSRIARPETRAALEAAGLTVDAPVVYDTVSTGDAELRRLREDGKRGEMPDACVFASPSAVASVLAGLGSAGRTLLSRARVRLVAIGPTTATALRGEGLHVAAEAAAPTAEGLAAAVAAAIGSPPT